MSDLSVVVHGYATPPPKLLNRLIYSTRTRKKSADDEIEKGPMPSRSCVRDLGVTRVCHTIFLYGNLVYIDSHPPLRTAEKVEHVDQTIGEVINIKHLFDIWRV